MTSTIQDSLRYVLTGLLFVSGSFLATPNAARGIVLSIHDLSVSNGEIHGSSVSVPTGETVTIGVRVEDPTGVIWTGLGLSYYGYDGTLIDFVEGQSVSEIFPSTCVGTPPVVFCLDAIPNFAGSASATGPNRALWEDTVFPGVPGAGSPRVRAMMAWQHLSSGRGQSGGTNDTGLDGVFEGGDAHMRVTFEAVGEGYTTITIGTGDDLGGVVLGAGGTPLPATNVEVRLAVPEPNLGAGLFAVLAAVAALGGRVRGASGDRSRD